MVKSIRALIPYHLTPHTVSLIMHMVG